MPNTTTNKEKIQIDKNFEKDYPKDGEQYVGSIYDIYEKAFKAGQNLGFTQGYTCACATMVNEHGDSTSVVDCYKNNFHSVKQLRELGCEEFDIKLLKNTIKEIENKKRNNG